MTHPLEVSRITITKYLDEDSDGGMTIDVEWGQDDGVLDLLGMLSFAEHDIVAHYFHGQRRDRKEEP